MGFDTCEWLMFELIIIIIIIIIIIEFLTSQLWLGNMHLSWNAIINRIIIINIIIFLIK